MTGRKSNIYDFTCYKIENMIKELEKEYLYHPDIDALKDILTLYKEDDVTIHWDGGYPMHEPTKQLLSFT
jgi:hypothetical protein